MPHNSSPDCRPRRRRLLNGERWLAARRLRSLADRRAARPRVCFLPTASGDADHYVVRFYRRFAADCEASHVSLFRRDQGTGGVEDDLATPPARPGPHLRGRRQRGQHARRLARARARRDPAQGLAPRRRAVRALGRLAVLVRAGAQRLPRRPRDRCAGWGCCPTPTASTTTPSPSGARSTTASWPTV